MSRFLAALALLFGLLSPPLQAQPTGLDPSFDGDGELLIPFPGLAPGSNDVYLDRLGLDHDERILIAGTDGAIGSRRGIVGRLLANGSADPAWAGSGFSVLDQRTDMDVADLVALPDGGALVCGNYAGTTASRTWVFVARFLSNGQLDPSFASASGNPGIYFAEPAGFDDFSCAALELMGDGRVAVAGATLVAAQQRTQPALLRLTSTGELDSSLAFGGYVRFNVDSDRSAVEALVEQPGIGLLAFVVDRFNLRWRLIRLRTDGSLDESFILQSGLFRSYSETWLSSNALALLPDRGMRVMWPDGLQSTQLETNVHHWLFNGGTGPIAPFILQAPGASDGLFSNGMVAAPDGRMVILGRHNIAPGNCRRQHAFLHLARRMANGDPDTGFGSNGQHSRFPLTPVFHPSDCQHGVDRVGDVLLDRAGRILSASTIVHGYPNAASATPVVRRPLLTRQFGSAFAAPAWDLTPNAISFVGVSTRPSTQVRSEVVTVGGLDNGVDVPAYVLGGELSRNGGGYTRLPTMVRNGDQLRVRTLAPAVSGQSSSARLYVGGIRAHNSWVGLGTQVQANFVVTADQPALPGVRCSSGGGSNCNAAIPDNGSVESTLNLVNPGSCNFITGVRVGIDLEHAFVGDLRITLTDPNGRVFIGGSEGIVNLVDRVPGSAGANPGSCGRRDVLAVYADDALREGQNACGQPLNQPALSGDLRPAQALSQLIGRRTTGNNGASSSGAWKLLVQDQAGGDTGQLHDWSLDLGCGASAPALSDLSASVSGPPMPVAGSTVNLSWTITNLGPVATGNGRFQAGLPTGLTDSLDNPAWGCSASAGGSCTPLIPCFGACIGSEIDAALSLPLGGTATFFATGTLTELAGDGLLTVNGRVWTPLAVGGTRDPNPLNDTVQYQAPIVRSTDLAVSSLSHAWSGQTLTVTAVVGNSGPSQASGFSFALDLPDGLVVQAASCDRSPLPCGGILAIEAGNVVRLTNAGLLSNRTPMTFVVSAQWAQSVSPGAMQAQVSADATASDPLPANNSASQTIDPPPAQTPLIFQNGFE